MMSTPTRFVENRLQLLEKRLTAVEKFIDLRFRHGSRQETTGIEVEAGPSSITSNAKQKELKDKEQRQEIEESFDSESVSSASPSKKTPVKRKIGRKKKLPGRGTTRQGKVTLRECVVRVSREEVDQRSGKSTSRRTKRAPKRFDDEEFSGNSPVSSKSCPTQESIVKFETSSVCQEAPMDPAEVNEDGNLETASVNDDDCQGDDFFSFVTPDKKPKGEDNSEVSSRSEVSQGSEDDKEADLDQPSKRKRRKRETGGKGTGKKRGKYKKRVKSEDDDASKLVKRRTFTRVELTELPQDSIAVADPSMRHCNLCNRHFKEEFFEAHLENHAKERHLTCPHCGKSYYNLFILRKHMKTHSPEKYTKKCRQCDKPFIHSDKLLHHERYCVRKSLEKNEHVDPSLIEDIRKRTKGDTSWIENAMETGARLNRTSECSSGERKLCPHCNKNFKVENFEKHLQTHSKVKNWSCNMCEKSYYYKHDLVRHLSMEHVVDHKCVYCDDSFSDRPTLKKHLTLCRRDQREKNRGTKQESPVKNQKDKEDAEQEVVEGGEIEEVSVGEIVQVLRSGSPSTDIGPATVIVIEEGVDGESVTTFEQPIATLQLVATDE